MFTATHTHRLFSTTPWQVAFAKISSCVRAFLTDSLRFGSSLTVEAWAELGALLSSPVQRDGTPGTRLPHSSLLSLCLFLGSCPENDWLQWTQEEDRCLRTQYSSSSSACLPACLPSCWGRQMHRGFTNQQLLQHHWIHRFDYDLFFSPPVIRSDRLDLSWAYRQTNRQTDWHMDRKQWALRRECSNWTSILPGYKTKRG